MISEINTTCYQAGPKFFPPLRVLCGPKRLTPWASEGDILILIKFKEMFFVCLSPFLKTGIHIISEIDVLPSKWKQKKKETKREKQKKKRGCISVKAGIPVFHQ